MFTADRTWSIKMSRGDDAQFPLYLNKGTNTEPRRYTFTPDDTEEQISFYIIPINSPFESYILKKTYTSTGDIITSVLQEDGSYEETTTHDNININELGDMVIKLFSEDTVNLKPGQYNYLIRGIIKTQNIDDSNFIIDPYTQYMDITLTNKLDFYLLDDGFNRSWENEQE